MKDSFKLADFCEPYEATDFIMNENLPRRQIRFLAKRGNTWQLTYRHGGRGMHYHFVEFSVLPSSVYLKLTGVALVDLDNRKQIDQARKNKKLVVKKFEEAFDHF